MAELRSFIFIDQLQPQTMCYLATWIRGSLPRARDAAQVIEVAPGIDIEALSINPTWYRAERDVAAEVIRIQNEAGEDKAAFEGLLHPGGDVAAFRRNGIEAAQRHGRKNRCGMNCPSPGRKPASSARQVNS